MFSRSLRQGPKKGKADHGGSYDLSSASALTWTGVCAPDTKQARTLHTQSSMLVEATTRVAVGDVYRVVLLTSGERRVEKPRRSLLAGLTLWTRSLLGLRQELVLSSSDLWLLGRCYLPTTDITIRADHLTTTPAHVAAFLSAFETSLYLTYQRGFMALPGGWRSDVGWGCMLRAGQMLLAQTLLVATVGKDWRVRDALATNQWPEGYTQLAEWLDDGRGPSAPFSIHSLLSASTRNTAGHWLGPSSVCHMIVVALSLCTMTQPLRGHLASDQCVDTSALGGDSTDWTPTLLLVPLRLGLRHVNPNYLPQLKECFRCPSFVGMVGGRPRHAVYMVGYQDDDAFYYDPHAVHTVHSSNKCLVATAYHCPHPRKIPLSSIDPSVALGFLLSTKEDLDQLCAMAHTWSPVSPLFTVCSSPPPPPTTPLPKPCEDDFVFV